MQEECLCHVILSADTFPHFIFGPTHSIFWKPFNPDFLKWSREKYSIVYVFNLLCRFINNFTSYKLNELTQLFFFIFPFSDNFFITSYKCI